MQYFLDSYEIVIRVAFFTGVLATLAILESFYPRKQRLHRRIKRWPHNLGLIALNSLLIRLVVPLTAYVWARNVAANGWGVFHNFTPPFAIGVIMGVVVLDLAIYLQHVVFHRQPQLWRLHQAHHADTDLDVTSGLRFHPIEMVLSLLIKMAVIVAFGIEPISVLVFEVVLNATAMFSHANVFVPVKIDRLLRRIIVTPDMHRIHHSTIAKETHSNFGFNLSLWDYVFRTYRAHPARGHQDMEIGLPQFRDQKYLGIIGIIRIPFVPGKR